MKTTRLTFKTTLSILLVAFAALVRVPAAAKRARAQGVVVVEITVDEKGKVASAHAVSGHTLLRPAGEEAARRAKFSPTTVCGKPVKVSGVITYNFVLN